MSIVGRIFQITGMLFFLGFSQVHGAELWSNSSRDARQFLSVKKNSDSIQLNYYTQNNGEYQNLISTHKFSSKENLDKFVKKNYSNLVPQNQLEFWPIKKIVETAQETLFFKRIRNDFIWQAKNNWNDQWEEKFGIWLKTEITTEFFKKYKISTDCADAVVGLRWIFARINYLPMASTLADSGNLFGNFSMKKEWKRYETSANWYEDRLFLAALEYVMNLTSSKTILNDGFPVKLSREGLIAGIYIVTQNPTSGHVRIVSEVNYDDITELPIYTLASTSPRGLRVMAREVFLDQEWPAIGTREILAFRWPVIINSNWVLQAKNSRPTYSQEQFNSDYKRDFPIFSSFIFSQVKGNYDPLKLVELGIKDILTYAEQRNQIIIEGEKFCKKNNCQPNSDGFEEWGTPSRDAKLLKKFYNVDGLIKEFEKNLIGLAEQWNSALRNNSITIQGVKLKLSGLRYILENNLHSSNASDNSDRRWGLNSSDLLSKWMNSIEKLLIDRNSIITRSEAPCKFNCNANSINWLSLESYHLDGELNQIYNQVKAYCSIISTNTCPELLANFGSKKLTFNGETKTLVSWFNLIPFFHSDPRVSFERRWGEIPSDINAVALPYFESIKVSNNSLALLDSAKLINLQSGNILYQSPIDERLVLTESGVVYKIIDTLGEIKRLKFEGNVINWVSIDDPDNLLKLEVNRPILMEENLGYVIFRKPLDKSLITFRILNDKIEFIKEHAGATNHHGALVTMAIDQNTLSLVDLDRSLNVNINVPQSEKMYDMNLITISSYKYPVAILSYPDQNSDIYYSAIVNLEKKTWTKIAPEIEEKYIILWSDAAINKAIIQTNFNNEFHNLYAISWDDFYLFKIEKLANRLMGTSVFNGSVYLIEGTGGEWDRNPKTKLYKWNDSLTEIAAPVDFRVNQITSLGVLFNSENGGVWQSFEKYGDYKLPKNLLPETQFCQNQTKSNDFINYRFNSSYGAFLCMGGSLSKSATTTNSINEIVPQFSLTGRLNEDNLLDQRWVKSFQGFEIKSGELIGIGRNIGIWWISK